MGHRYESESAGSWVGIRICWVLGGNPNLMGHGCESAWCSLQSDGDASVSLRRALGVMPWVLSPGHIFSRVLCPECYLPGCLFRVLCRGCYFSGCYALGVITGAYDLSFHFARSKSAHVQELW